MRLRERAAMVIEAGTDENRPHPGDPRLPFKANKAGTARAAIALMSRAPIRPAVPGAVVYSVDIALGPT